MSEPKIEDLENELNQITPTSDPETLISKLSTIIDGMENLLEKTINNDKRP